MALFSNDKEDYIKSVISSINVDIIQFHGDETNEFSTSLFLQLELTGLSYL